MLEEELVIVCKNKNVKWPIMFKRFIDDGFGIMRGNKKDVESWIYKFNQLIHQSYYQMNRMNCFEENNKNNKFRLLLLKKSMKIYLIYLHYN